MGQLQQGCRNYMTAELLAEVGALMLGHETFKCPVLEEKTVHPNAGHIVGRNSAKTSSWGALGSFCTPKLQ